MFVHLFHGSMLSIALLSSVIKKTITLLSIPHLGSGHSHHMASQNNACYQQTDVSLSVSYLHILAFMYSHLKTGLYIYHNWLLKQCFVSIWFQDKSVAT